MNRMVLRINCKILSTTEDVSASVMYVRVQIDKSGSGATSTVAEYREEGHKSIDFI